jgi:uncharacterized protein YjeT (DUF2065 family)
VDWQDFGTAFALMMIFEGISPFIMPDRMRKLAAVVQQTNDKHIRIVALISMVSGLMLLFWLRNP